MWFEVFFWTVAAVALFLVRLQIEKDVLRAKHPLQDQDPGDEDG